jgi:hypothetical protein
MQRHIKAAGLTLLALLALAPLASAYPPGFGFRGGFGGPGFVYAGPGFYYGPGWGWGYGWYGPGWYEPYGYIPGPVAGKVKVQNTAKDTQVYVDNGYAGTVKQLGTFPLKAGTHDIELRAPNGQSLYHEQINVIAGKTVDLKPN